MDSIADRCFFSVEIDRTHSHSLDLFNFSGYMRTVCPSANISDAQFSACVSGKCHHLKSDNKRKANRLATLPSSATDERDQNSPNTSDDVWTSASRSWQRSRQSNIWRLNFTKNNRVHFFTFDLFCWCCYLFLPLFEPLVALFRFDLHLTECSLVLRCDDTLTFRFLFFFLSISFMTRGNCLPLAIERKECLSVLKNRSTRGRTSRKFSRQMEVGCGCSFFSFVINLHDWFSLLDESQSTNVFSTTSSYESNWSIAIQLDFFSIRFG